MTVAITAGVPHRVALKYANFSHSAKAKENGWPPQLGLKGEWSKPRMGEAGWEILAADDSAYMPLDEPLAALGALGVVVPVQGQLDNFGGQKYAVTPAGVVLEVMMTEDGRKHNYDFMVVPAANGDGSPAKPVSRETPAPPDRGYEVPTGPPAPPKTDRKAWAAFRATAYACISIAFDDKAPWPAGIGESQRQGFASTLFIQASMQRLMVYPPDDGCCEFCGVVERPASVQPKKAEAPSAAAPSAPPSAPTAATVPEQFVLTPEDAERAKKMFAGEIEALLNGPQLEDWQQPFYSEMYAGLCHAWEATTTDELRVLRDKILESVAAAKRAANA